MGVNDGGKYVKMLKERKELFRKYVGSKINNDVGSEIDTDAGGEIIVNSTQDENMTPHTQKRPQNLIFSNKKIVEPEREPELMYKIIDRRMPSGAIIRVILLDTRSHRDYHYIRSLGEIKFPLTPLIAALIRGTYSVLGVGREHKGKYLHFNKIVLKLICFSFPYFYGSFLLVS